MLMQEVGQKKGIPRTMLGFGARTEKAIVEELYSLAEKIQRNTDSDHGYFYWSYIAVQDAPKLYRALRADKRFEVQSLAEVREARMYSPGTERWHFHVARLGRRIVDNGETADLYGEMVGLLEKHGIKASRSYRVD